MEPSRQQAARSDQKGWGCDSARSASFNAHYRSRTHDGSRQSVDAPRRLLVFTPVYLLARHLQCSGKR
jgi:hypothetical protein